MLGYVKPYKPEMKIKEYECYRGYYCSLCKALGKQYGLLSRLFLSFDVTFFLIFLFAIKQNANISFKKGRCPFNPLKECQYMDTDGEEFRFACAFTILMTYYKLKDNLNDNGFFRRIKYYFAYPYVYLKFKKAKMLFPDADKIIRNSIEKQSKIEKEQNSSVDIAADASASALGSCFELFADTDEKKQLYRYFGYSLGRFVYLCDAFDDYEKDKKSGSYNVFINNNYTDEQIISSIRMSIHEAIISLDLFDFYYNKSILKNIIEEGLDSELDKIIKKREGSKNEKRSV